MYSGQAMVHTSGALDADVLAPAQAAGTQVGAFHPLVAFADTERAVAALHGATVAIEADDQLAALLADMAEAIGARPVRLAPGSKAAYHAAAVLAAGGFVALLDAIATLGRVAGLDEAGSLAIYGPLIEGTLGNARALGIAATPDRADRPWRRRDTRRAPRGARAPTRPTSCRSTGRSRSARWTSPSPVARWHRSTPHAVRRALARQDSNRYHGLDGSQHRRQVRGPAGGPFRPSLGPGAGAAARPRIRDRLPTGRRPPRPSCAAPTWRR